jgi:hypothetical protein
MINSYCSSVVVPVLWRCAAIPSNSTIKNAIVNFLPLGVNVEHCVF